MLTLNLSSPAVAFENAGGKGASLARLAILGLPVPPGFIVTTEACRRFVAANDLDRVITACLADLVPDDAGGLETLDPTRRAAFSPIRHLIG